MKELQFVIKDPDGIHARPAGIFVKRMQAFPCSVTVKKGEKQADGKKLFALMKLAAKKGETVTVTAEGEQEEAALLAVQDVINETNL